MLKITRKYAYLALVSGALSLAPMAHAGSGIGGNPSNGGGTTFGVDNLTSALGAEAIAEAVATGDPIAIDAAILAAIAASGFTTGDRLSPPLTGLTGAQTVTALVDQIVAFAAAVGLALTAPSIQALLAIAETADDVA